MNFCQNAVSRSNLQGVNNMSLFRELINECTGLLEKPGARVRTATEDEYGLTGYQVEACGKEYRITSGFVRQYISGPADWVLLLEIAGIKYANSFIIDDAHYAYASLLESLYKKCENKHFDLTHPKRPDVVSISIGYLRGSK